MFDRSFNPFDPKEYSHWYHYIWAMPLVVMFFVWNKACNKVHDTFRRR